MEGHGQSLAFDLLFSMGLASSLYAPDFLSELLKLIVKF